MSAPSAPFPAGADEPDPLLADDVSERVVTGGVQRGVAFAVSNLLATGAAIIILRYLGVAAFGRYGTVMALLTIVLGITDAGLTITATRELAVVRGNAERRHVLAHVLGLRIVLTTLGVGLAVAFAALAGYGETLVAATLVGGLGVILSSVSTAMLLPLALELRNGMIAAFDVLRQAALVIVVVVVVLLGGGIVALFGAQLITALLLLGLTPLALRGGGLVRPQLTRARTRALLIATLPLAISAVFGVIYFRLLVVLMSLLSDSEREIGLYATSARVVELAGSLPYVLMAVLLPVVTAAARDDRERLSYITARTADAMAVIGISLALVLAAAARPVVLILGGYRYEAAAGVLEIQAFALVTIFLSAAWSSTLIGLGRQRWLAYAAASGLVAAFALGAVLIPADQARGAAIAAVLADLVLCVVTYIGLRRAGAATEFGRSRFARFAIATAPGVALVIWGGLPDVVDPVLALGSFLVISWLLGLIPAEIVERARSVTGRRPHRAPI